jgi:hypothetical protein
MLDSDLALLYGVETGALNRAVKRNRSRFPGDFMFRLTAAELQNLRRQTGISSFKYGGRRYLPYRIHFGQKPSVPHSCIGKSFTGHPRVVKNR